MTHVFNRSEKCLAPWESQVEALYARGKQELDFKRRVEITREIQNIWASNQALIYITSSNWHSSWNARVRGEYPQNVMNAYVTTRDLDLTWIQP